MNDIPKEIMELGKPVSFKRGKHIYNNGQIISKCYLIINGKVKIYIDHSNGRRSIIDFATSGNWLGELSIYSQEIDVKENKVLTDTSCLEFDIKKIRELTKSNTKVSNYFAQHLTNKLVERSKRMSESLSFPLEVKLARFILEHQEQGKYMISHSDASEYFNVSYRHVLLVISKLCRKGYINKQNKYLISDFKGLKALALIE